MSYKNQDIQKIIESVSALYPKAELPKHKSQWDIGHKCLDYFSKVLPLDRLLLPSWILLMMQHTMVGMRPIPDTAEDIEKDVDALSNALKQGVNRISLLRDEKKFKGCSLELVKKYQSANCAELAEISYLWLLKQGYNAHLVLLNFYDAHCHPVTNGHEFVLYTPSREVDLSFNQMMNDLNNPAVRILDIWGQKVGLVPDVLNEYARLFVRDDNPFDPEKLESGLSIGLEGKLIKEVIDLNLSIKDHVIGQFVVGKTAVSSENNLCVHLAPQAAYYPNGMPEDETYKQFLPENLMNRASLQSLSAPHDR